ncbi:rCG37117 [Rattus norvegicus]|uniref:RCG37117 n=1 Tax=Rattus norvegicus TaxID=10116 RepID=A6HUJ5_RAT|nr:rCG37117 [Rattus norvegicus]
MHHHLPVIFKIKNTQKISFFFFLVLFFRAGDRTQGLALPRQALENKF